MHFSSWIFNSFWDRFGVFGGPCWEPKSTPKAKGVWEFFCWFRPCCLMVPRWPPRPFQEGSGGGIGPSWAHLGGVLGRSWGLLGPIWTVLGLVLDRLRVVLEPFWGSIRWFDSSLWFNDEIRRFDLLIRFVSFINSLSTQRLGRVLGRSWSSRALFLDSIGSLDGTVILNHIVNALSTHELGPAWCAKRLNKRLTLGSNLKSSILT